MTKHRILAFVVALIFLTVLGSTVTLYRITQVNRSLSAIHDVAVPFGKLMSQLQSDSESLKREVGRRLNIKHWYRPHWMPRAVPVWMNEIIDSDLSQAQALLSRHESVIEGLNRSEWVNWLTTARAEYEHFRGLSDRLYEEIRTKNWKQASQLYPAWTQALSDWQSRAQEGARRSNGIVREAFAGVRNRVSGLRTGLEVLLIVVVFLSLLLLWLGEKALRPLGELTQWVRSISHRGLLEKEDKSRLPVGSLNREDEIGRLMREFHAMATTLLEREKTVQSQKLRLEEQNRLLKDMGALRERLQAAEHLAAVGRMSAQVAHEIRNPLHSIGLEAEMALEAVHAGQTPSAKLAVQSILSGVDRLAKITENYLKLSKMSSGERKRVDLSEILENVLATYTVLCEKNKIRVDWVRDEGPWMVFADPDLMEQIFGNLFKNAIQALAHQPDASVRWQLSRSSAGEVQISIDDNGPGLSKEILEKLFIPFVTTKAQGTGLGLSFAKKGIEDHGGRIGYRKSPLGGARFEIHLQEMPADRKEIKNDSVCATSLGG